MSHAEETLRRLAIRDQGLLDSVLGCESTNLAQSGLDAKTYALVQIAALVAVGAAPPSYLPVADAAREAGASMDEVVGTLIAVMAPVGAARVVAAAPRVGLALGYDVSDGLEVFSE